MFFFTEAKRAPSGDSIVMSRECMAVSCKGSEEQLARRVSPSSVADSNIGYRVDSTP